MSSIFDLDRHLYILIHSRLRARWLDPVMIWFTKAGTKGVLWLGLAAGMVIDSSLHARGTAFLAVAALLLAEGLINLVLKPAIRRERPYARPGLASLLIAAPGPNSWPSAHAGSSVAAAVVLTARYPEWGIVWVSIAALIAYSRIYVGVHYPLDVVAGILVGCTAAGVVLLVGSMFSLS
jgi:undecaprenyl-diphosphatase